MKKILIVTYYFPPCNVVSANRLQSFADNFARYGLYPIVATRHWTGDEIDTEGYESGNLTPPEITENESFTVIRLPFQRQLDTPLHRLLTRAKWAKLALYAALYALGNINPKCNAYAEFYAPLDEYLNKSRVDYVMATGFPMNTIRLGHELAKKHGTKFIADFRDLWDNRLLDDNFNPGMTDRLQLFFYEFYIRRWLSNASLVTSVTQPLVDELTRLSDARTEIVPNGFEAVLFHALRAKYQPPREKFSFSVIGTLKPGQDLPLMLEGLELFLKGKDLHQIDLSFIGVNEFPEVRRLIADRLPRECTTTTERIPRERALAKMLRSHVLYYAGWRGSRGVASAKIYEYLGAHRNILIAPSDHDVIERIINSTRAGALADTPEQFAESMNSWFAEWKTTGAVAYHGDENEIERYSRENQAEKLATAILSIE